MTLSADVSSTSASTSLLGPSAAAGWSGEPVDARLVKDEASRTVDGSPQFRRRPLGGIAKRVLDVVVASAALVAAAPMMIIIAVLIRVTMGGPVLFQHKRICFHGREFSCLKFRTMVKDANAVLEAHFKTNPEAAVEWTTSHKLKRDPRITLLGQLLRKSSLDELPQLFNILRGEMSCVGPRPITHAELERYGSVANDYLNARPGLTGLWQVNGRSSVDYAGRVMLDAQYLRNWSLRSDLVILVRTTGAVIRFEQAS